METTKVINVDAENNVPVKRYLTADQELELHTDTAQALFNGQWQVGRMGLLQYASLMNALWKAYKKDDPYAAWYLLKGYEALEEAKDKIKAYENELQLYMSSLRGFKINLFSSTVPLQRVLRFATSFAFNAAILVEQVDYVARQLYTLNRISLITKVKLNMSTVIMDVQTAFAVPRKWQHTGVTRKDIKENNQTAQRAKSMLGAAPAAVFNKEIKFALLPGM